MRVPLSLCCSFKSELKLYYFPRYPVKVMRTRMHIHVEDVHAENMTNYAQSETQDQLSRGLTVTVIKCGAGTF